MRPTEPSGSSQAAAEAEPWIITESLPFGTDVMQTIPLEFGEGLPVEVGLLMQRAGQKTVEEKKSMEEKDRRTTKPIEPSMKNLLRHLHVFQNMWLFVC